MSEEIDKSAELEHLIHGLLELSSKIEKSHKAFVTLGFNDQQHKMNIKHLGEQFGLIHEKMEQMTVQLTEILAMLKVFTNLPEG